MGHLICTKGLDLPFEKLSTALRTLPKPAHLGLPILEEKPDVLVQEKEVVAKGQLLMRDAQGRHYLSPGGGKVQTMGKASIVIALSDEEQSAPLPSYSSTFSPLETVDYLNQCGVLCRIRKRPFGQRALPGEIPRAIFVSACSALPFAVPFSLESAGREEMLRQGLLLLSRITKTYLIVRQGTPLPDLPVSVWTVSGPHPSGDPSFHIHSIDPIQNESDCVWPLSLATVLALGKMSMTGQYPVEQTLFLAGDGVAAKWRGYYQARLGYPIGTLYTGKGLPIPIKLIKGDPLTGKEGEIGDFLNFEEEGLTVLPALPYDYGAPLPFSLRPKAKGWLPTLFSLSGRKKKQRSWTTCHFGPAHSFLLNPSLYDAVFPLKLSPSFLIRDIITKRLDLAKRDGLLEVVPQDFALAAFLCPSKCDLMGIVSQAQKKVLSI